MSSALLPSIVLASTSPYRRQLLERLRLPFDVASPGVDESRRRGESAARLAMRLALAKACAVAQARREAIVIGSDQVAELDGRLLGKPGTHEAALAQLESVQGRTVAFRTALAVVRHADTRQCVDCIDTQVRFRRLPTAALESYLALERPYDCAGAAKIESLGICLVESVHSDDPTALIGLPLIRLTSMLAAFGIPLPAI